MRIGKTIYTEISNKIYFKLIHKVGHIKMNNRDMNIQNTVFLKIRRKFEK